MRFEDGHDLGRKAKPRDPVRWLRRNPYTFAFVIGSLVMGGVVARKVQTEFEWVYILTARHLVNGEGLYGLTSPPFRSYTYPPFMAALFLPLAFVPSSIERAAWFLVTVSCVLLTWRGAWKLSGGGRLENAEAGSVDGREHTVAILGLASVLPYLESGVSHQQTDPLIVWLLIAGCLALERSRDWRAATYFGLAAGMKCTPLLWAPFLAWRGRWKAAAWLVAVAVGVNLLPNLIQAPKGGGFWLGQWIDQFLRPMGRADYRPGQWYAWILDNQSLAGTLTRWATTRPAWGSGQISVINRIHPPTPRTLRVLIYGIEGLLLVVAGLATRRRATPDESTGMPRATRRALECSVVLLLMLLFSPMSSRPHFASMILPALCLARLAVFEDRRSLRWWLLASIVTSIAALPLSGPSIGRLTMWAGMLTCGALFLLTGCMTALLANDRQRKRLATTASIRFDASGASGVGSNPIAPPHLANPSRPSLGRDGNSTNPTGRADCVDSVPNS
jgi:hypothetical protein